MSIRPKLPTRIFLFVLLPMLLAFGTLLFLLWPYFVDSKITKYSLLGFFSLVQEHKKNILENFTTNEIIAGEKAKGSFVARENNLGIVLIRFYNFIRISKDVVIFRIRETSQERWYFENKYKVNQFQPDQYFTFGFPPITDSKGKTYYFEIESERGTPGDAIGLSSVAPYSGVVYTTSKNQVLGDFNFLFRFMVGKMVYALNNIDVLIPVVVFLSSLVLEAIFLKRKVIYSTILKLIICFRSSKLLKKAKKAFYYFLYSSNKTTINIYLRTSSLLIKEGRRTGKAINLILDFLAVKNSFLFPYFHIIFIFSIAFLVRVSFYFDPENFDDFFFSQIGGGGDYDLLLRHTMRFIINNDLLAYFWSLINDYAINIRLFALFINFFGFLKGIDYAEYFLIFLGSVVCLLPFIILSRLKKNSLGGFLASLFLAINPLSSWLATSRPLDVLTSFFFAIFILLFVLSLEKRSYFLAVLLGLVGFIDGFNRPLMILNDLPVLGLFALFYLYLQGSFSFRFPFVKLSPPSRNFPFGKQFNARRLYASADFISQRGENIDSPHVSLGRFNTKDLFYAFLPLLTFLVIYTFWNYYYFFTFKVVWFFAPKFLITIWNPINDPEGILGEGSWAKLLNYSLLSFLAIEKIPRYISLSILFLLAQAVLVFFLVKQKERKADLYLALIPLVFVAIFYGLNKFLPWQRFFIVDISKPSFRYFLGLTDLSFVTFLVFLEYIMLQALILKREFFKYFLPIVFYILALGYGLYLVFSDRHYIQVVLVFFLLFGLSIDKLMDLLLKSKARAKHLLVLIYIVGLLVFIDKAIFNSVSKLITGVRIYQEEKQYLKHVDAIIPEDGIILVSSRDKQNVIWISRFLKRSIVFNVNNSNPVFIASDKKYFLIPISARYSLYPWFSFISGSDQDFVISAILQDKDKFSQYQFFILDYDISGWEKILGDRDSGHPFFPIDRFDLEWVDKDYSQRPIYQLVWKNKD